MGNFSMESLLRMGSVVYSVMRFLQNHTLGSVFVFAFPYVRILFAWTISSEILFFLFPATIKDNFDIDFAC